MRNLIFLSIGLAFFLGAGIALWVSDFPKLTDFSRVHQALTELQAAAASEIPTRVVRANTDCPNDDLTNSIIQTDTRTIADQIGKAKNARSEQFRQLEEAIKRDTKTLSVKENADRLLVAKFEQEFGQRRLIAGWFLGGAGLVMAVWVALTAYQLRKTKKLFAYQNVEYRSMFDAVEKHKEAELKARELVAQTEKKYVALMLAHSFDPMTKALKRHTGEGYLQREIQTYIGTAKEPSVLFLDIDDFRNFNNTYGHDAGDSVLKELVTVANAVLREGDFIVRYGGEEFFIVFHESPLAESFKAADRLREAFSKNEVWIGNQFVKCSFSGGLACISELPSYHEVLRISNSSRHEIDLEVLEKAVSDLATELIAYADWNMYNSKKTTKNRVSVSSDRERENPHLENSKIAAILAAKNVPAGRIRSSQ